MKTHTKPRLRDRFCVNPDRRICCKWAFEQASLVDHSRYPERYILEGSKQSTRAYGVRRGGTAWF
jgi:hypothetical protein